MIKLTKLDGSTILLNPDLIETVEESPDTHITLNNGNRYLVLEKAAVIVERIVAFKAGIIRRAESVRNRKYLRRQQVANYRPGPMPDEPGRR